MSDVPTASLDQPHQPAEVPILQTKGGEAVAETPPDDPTTSLDQVNQPASVPVVETECGDAVAKALPDVPTTSPDHSNQAAEVPIMPAEGGEAVAETLPDVPTTSSDQPDQPAEVPVMQTEGSKVVAESLPSLQEFIRNVPRQSDTSLSASDHEKLGKILERMSPEEVNANDDNDGGQTALHHVARRGLKGVVACLVKSGAKVSVEDAKKNQPLFLSCQEGFILTTTELLEQGAKDVINAQNSLGETALHIACRRGRRRTVRRLLKYKAKTNVLTSISTSPLFHASARGHLDIVQLLLAEKAWDRNLLETQSNKTGRTPLHAAVKYNRPKVAQELLDKGSPRHICDSSGWTPLMTATKEKSVTLMKILLQPSKASENLQLDKPDKKGDTPLKAAATECFLPGVDMLIKAGAKCTSRDLDMKEETLALLLRTASRLRYSRIVECLLGSDNIRNCHVPDEDGWSGLTYASFYGHATIVKLFLENQAKIGLSEEEKGMALQAASKQGYGNIVKQLLDEKIKTPVDFKDQEGMTALHHAIRGDIHDIKIQDEKSLGPDSVDGDKETHTGSEPGKHDDVAQLLLKDGGAKPGQKGKDGETALHVAVRSAKSNRTGRVELIVKYMEDDDVWAENEKDQTALDLAFEATNTENQAANWGGDGHQIARLILSKCKLRTEDGVENPESNDWSAIEWAAYHALPEVLALLLINSTSMKETMECIDSAKALVVEKRSRKKELMAGEKSVRVGSGSDPAERSGQNEDDNEDDQNDDDSKPSEDNKISNPEDDEDESNREHLVMDILNDPQIVVIKDSESYELPQPERGLEGVPKHHGASIFQFYSDDNELSIIQRFRTVQQVVYDEGPKQIMKEAVDNLKKIYGKLQSRPRIADLKTKTEPKPDFTWVHLSSTNMVWMEDALKRILIEEGYSRNQFQMMKSFFQDSWAEIPDKTSPSRFMRPQHSYKSFKTEENGLHGRYNALYIPYLSFARYCPGHCSEYSENTRDDDPHEKRKRQKLHQENQRCLDLLEAYRNRVIHSPSTLDEWYYHFAPEDTSYKDSRSEDTSSEDTSSKNTSSDDTSSEDTSSEDTSSGYKSVSDSSFATTWSEDSLSDDKQRRNQTQVVTKSLGDNTRKGDHWRLARVNQLWAWVIGNKWLITATWDPIDGVEETLPQGIIDHIRKQAKVRGQGYQPHSPFYMTKLLVDYCIGAYERAPITTDKHEQQVSIRQIFSNYINTIGRDETLLFERFSKFSLKTNDSRGLQHLLLDEEIRTATQEAKRLSCEIKDTRDELNILKSVAQYQNEVEQKLFANNPSKTGSSNASLRANYMVDDVKQMDRISLRLQSSISETLSLQQSEIANLQATLSVEQGETLMIFTTVTILFLPLSFLSSFFAMDTEAFQKSAWWAKLIVFLLSFALFLSFPIIIGPINQLARYVSNKHWRGIKHWRDIKHWRYKIPFSGATGSISTRSHDVIIDFGSRTPSEVEEAITVTSIRKRDKLAMRFRKSG